MIRNPYKGHFLGEISLYKVLRGVQEILSQSRVLVVIKKQSYQVNGKVRLTARKCLSLGLRRGAGGADA